MAVTVRVPTVLRAVTGGHAELEAAGATVGEVLVSLGERHQQLLGRITNEAGEIRQFVFVNGEDIRFAEDLRTAVGDGDEISIVPSIAGG
jgi:molybdopterin synthase sulfur carrier subunit